jgi:hydrogenase maturation protease
MYDSVVIGLGSPLMGDDGLGIVALNRLREEWSFEPHVELVDGGTWGMNLLHLIEGANAVVLIDAVTANGTQPGRVVTVEREQLPKFLATKLSPHQIDLKEVLALAEFRGTLPERTVAIGQQPARVEMSTELSAPVLERMDALLEKIVSRLESWGHTAQRMQVDAGA